MKSKMKFSLKAGERIFVNGAVLRAENRVKISLLNDASFLLEAYVMPVDQATSPLRRAYFLIQAIILSPTDKKLMQSQFETSFPELRTLYESHPEVKVLDKVFRLVTDDGKYFDALKKLKSVFHLDDKVSTPSDDLTLAVA